MTTAYCNQEEIFYRRNTGNRIFFRYAKHLTVAFLITVAGNRLYLYQDLPDMDKHLQVKKAAVGLIQKMQISCRLRAWQ
jgi:hypothetical protein